jgi:hypothetical protein
MKRLKYQDEIDKLETDFSDFKEQTRVSYRWTFEDISDYRNFLPRYKLNPRPNDDDYRGWGLSFFYTKESAIKRMMEMKSTRKNIDKKLGTHVAKGTLTESDGISDSQNDKGHFTHFEYFDVFLQNNYTVICIINE